MRKIAVAYFIYCYFGEFLKEVWRLKSWLKAESKVALKVSPIVERELEEALEQQRTFTAAYQLMNDFHNREE